MYGLFGKFQAQPGRRDALLDHLLKAAAMMPEVKGCYLYVINRDPADPDGIWVYEAWRSPEDHRASLEHEAVIALISAARPLIADMPQRYELTPVGGLGLPDHP
jgi:quinol monooxygenase YgiN